MDRNLQEQAADFLSKSLPSNKLEENDKHKIGKNDHDARELHTYADNHADLHRQRITPIHKNLRNKMASGKYDHDKAHKAFGYAAKDAADRYKKEHGHTFSKGDRDKVAGAMRDQFHDEAKDGHHDNHLHKKYKGHKVESVQQDLEESNAALLKKFQTNIKDFQSFGKASGMSPRNIAGMTKQLMSIHGMLKKGDVRGAKKASKGLGDMASDIIPAKLMREDVQLDELHRDTLKSYARKSQGDIDGIKNVLSSPEGKGPVSPKHRADLEREMRNRKKGGQKAIRKAYTSEDAEQVDELDAGTLIRYNNAASQQVTRDTNTDTGKVTPKTTKRLKGALKARKKLDKIMPGLRAEDVSEEMTDAQANKKERIVKAMKEKRPGSYFMKKYGKDGKDVMYATATKLAMKDHVEWEEILESDEKPLMRWFAQFEREIKKHGMKYKSVDPVKMLKLYYKNVNPKNAAAILAGKGKGSDADYAALESVQTPPKKHATDNSSWEQYKDDNAKTEAHADDMVNFDKMKKQREAESKKYGMRSGRPGGGEGMGEGVGYKKPEPAHFAKKRDDGTYSVLKNHPRGAMGMSHGHDKDAADRLVAKHNKSAEVRSRRDAGIPDVKGKYKGQRLFADVDHEIDEQEMSSKDHMNPMDRVKMLRRAAMKKQVKAVKAEKIAKAQAKAVKTEEFELEEKNVPTNPSLWSKFKSQAKSKFDVYPSAYANGWASKQYKAAGGKWKKANESVEVEEAKIIDSGSVTYQAKDRKEYQKLYGAGMNAMDNKMTGRGGMVSDRSKLTVKINFKDEKTRKKFEKGFGITESVELDEAKSPVKSLGKEAKNVLAMAINRTTKGGPEAHPNNLDYFTPKAINAAIKFLDKNSKKLTPAGRHAAREIVKMMGESVEEQKNCGCGQDPCITYGKDVSENGDDFKPHIMYDPKTGKGYKAETKKDHEEMEKKGYSHDDPKTKKVEESVSEIQNVANWLTFMKRNAK